MGSGGGGGGGNPQALYQNAAPMQGLPIAGSESTIGSPYEYGQFQSFLPELSTDGSPNPMATGLSRDMLQFRSPTGTVAPNTGDGQIATLRNDLAKLRAEQALLGAKKPDDPFDLNAQQLRDYGTTSSGYGG